jgi:hypothetical protein
MVTVETIESFRGKLDIHPGDLPYDIWQVFDRKAFEACPNARIVPVAKLVGTKDQRQDPSFLAGQKPDPRQTAFDRMVDAANGLIDRREPITVVAKSDGTFHVADGNATAQVLMLVGWKEVPVSLILSDR